jgi:TRAP-type C4-dicarboxylate transport system permease small subunit
MEQAGGSVKRWCDLVSKCCGWGASVFLAAMMLLTVADVTLRAAFNTPIRGTYELIELLLACTFFVALPAVFLREEHIIVDVIDNLAPRCVPVLKRVAEALAVVILAVMAWQGWIAAADTLVFNDATADLGLPKTLHWAALLVGLIVSGFAALTIVLRGRNDR